jgi:hypothetical protein
VSSPSERHNNDSRLTPEVPGASRAPRLRVLLLCVACATIATACVSASRRDAPPPKSGAVSPVGFPPTVRSVGETRRRFETDARPLLAAVRSATRGGPINILALSGGGVGGAFGAGALVGWSRTGKRPDFHIVTGISAGALIAPFAFLGSTWDAELTEAFSGVHAQHLLKYRWASALVGSIYQGEPLAALVTRFATKKMLRAVASEASKGRVLLVATTDLDKAQTVIWNLGAIASRGGPEARRLFCDVLVASASIPGLFPPVLIRVHAAGGDYDEMHVDGGTTASLFVGPEVAAIIPNALDDLEDANLYVLVNGQFGTIARTTPLRTIPILMRSVSAALESDARRSVEYASSLAQRYQMNVRVTDIPDDYPYRGPLDLAPSSMKALFDFGMKCALAGALWAAPVDVLEKAERARTPTVDGPVECPGAKLPGILADSPP